MRLPPSVGIRNPPLRHKTCTRPFQSRDCLLFSLAFHAQPDIASARNLNIRVSYSVCGTTVYPPIGRASHRRLRFWTCSRAEDFRHAKSPIPLSSNSNATAIAPTGSHLRHLLKPPELRADNPHGVASPVSPVRVAVAISTGGIRPVTPSLCRASAGLFSPPSAL